MIVFDLICSNGHGFEAWFRDSGSFDRLADNGDVQCAVCGDTKIRKALMAPNISPSKAKSPSERREDSAPDRTPPAQSQGETGGQPAVAGSPTMAVQRTPATPSGQEGLPVPEKIAEAMQILRKVQTHIEKTFDHVGSRFAEEARKMHYGESEQRSIYGQATDQEAQELVDEGIDVNRMPWLPSRNS